MNHQGTWKRWLAVGLFGSVELWGSAPCLQAQQPTPYVLRLAPVDDTGEVTPTSATAAPAPLPIDPAPAPTAPADQPAPPIAVARVRLAPPPPSSAANPQPAPYNPGSIGVPTPEVGSTPGVPSPSDLPPGSMQPGAPNPPSLSPDFNPWGVPQGPQASEQAAARGNYAEPLPGNAMQSGYGPCGSQGAGFLHGSLLRMFVCGNDTERATRYTGASELFAGWHDWAPPAADRMPNFGIVAWESYELWRNLPDGNQRPNGNNGMTQGVNFGAPVPWLSEFGIGVQLGVSYGAFNFVGDTEQQTFVTAGFFRRSDAERPVNFGVVQDWMIAEGYGAYGQSFMLGQLRAQVAYAFSARDEVGFQGSIRDNQANKFDPVTGAALQYRAISQGSLFWHHKFGPGRSDLWLWTGVPSAYRLGGTTTPAAGNAFNDFETNIYGFRTETPFTDRVKVFSFFQGLRPTGGASTHALYNFQIGLSFYPLRNSRSRTVAGQAWTPLMPVANNGTFLTDTNQTF